MSRWVDVAVPIPLCHPLTYSVPPAWQALASAGVRARVPVGKRRLVGWILGSHDQPDESMTIRPLLEVLDREPALPEQLLELARFVADYYLAPIGEVLRCVAPSELPAWADRRYRLTPAGALSTPAEPLARDVVGLLLERGTLRAAELQVATGGAADLGDVLDRLEVAGGVRCDGSRRGARYRGAVERMSGDLEEQVARCGRSVKGVAVLRQLALLGRPALIEEITEAAGCSKAVLNRLTALGLLRRFTQIENLPLSGHLLASRRQPAAIVLRSDQRGVLQPILSALDRRAYEAFLLCGVTGSGKTEVYLRAADRAIEQGRGVLLLVPEIALVPALAATVRARYPGRAALLHSSLRGSERQQEWERVASGEARVVVGPRSALFAPIADLGLVVVDEEHDASYKQDATPRYHGRDLALVRARLTGAVAVLASATPSLESRHNVTTGKLQALALRQRVGLGAPVEGVLVDLRQESAGRRPGEVRFSGTLCEAIESCLADGDQAILLRNRRGYAPILLCRACGEDHRCVDCGLPRTVHRRPAKLICHYCGGLERLPVRCAACGEEALEAIGAGTERVEEIFGELFPGVSVALLDRDAAQRPGGAASVLERFRSGDAQVLIGTQMVAKGHHFPRVALAGVLAADSYLGFPDFRAVERTYNLLVQLAGRSGRGERPGRVVIQTFHPDHYAIRAALSQDDELFASSEMRFRETFHYPPFSRMIQLRLEDRQRERAEQRMIELAEHLRRHPAFRGVRMSGPAPAPLERLRGRWRFQLLVRGPSASRLRAIVSDTLAQLSFAGLDVDVDPHDLM